MELSRHTESRYDSLWALSQARAKAVMDYLTSNEIDLRSDRFRLVTVADREPLAERAYTVAEQAPNRRVEVIVGERLTREVKGR